MDEKRITFAQLEDPQIERNPWVDHVFRPAVLILMSASLSLAVVQLIRLFNPAWRGGYWLAALILVTAEAIFAYQAIRHLRARGISILRYRLVELAVLALFLKVMSYVGQPMEAILTDLGNLASAPRLFFTNEYLSLLGVALLIWHFTSRTMADFEALYDPLTFRDGHNSPLNNVTRRFFWGGAVLLVIAGMGGIVAQNGVERLIDTQRPSLGGIFLNVLGYFLLGLMLLSQVQLSNLLTRWQLQQASIEPGVIRNWIRYGVLLLLGVGIAVFFLPTGYSLGFLDAARLTLAIMIELIFFVLQFLFFLMILPFILLAMLFGMPVDGVASGAPMPPALPPVADSPQNTIPWLEVLRSFLFWFVFLGTGFYLIKLYLEDHPALWQAFTRFRTIKRLINLLAALVLAIISLFEAGVSLLPGRAGRATRSEQPNQRSGRRSRRPWRGIFRSPRARIWATYLQLLGEAEGLGVYRRRGETPRELQARLVELVPDQAEALALLTTAFLQARYDPRSPDREQAALVNAVWRKLKSVLRALKTAPAEYRKPKT